MTFNEYVQNGTGTATISGEVNGTNTLFTLPVAPTRLQLYLNGDFLLDEAFGLSTWDFSWTPAGLGTQTATITFNPLAVPQIGDTLIAWIYVVQP